MIEYSQYSNKYNTYFNIIKIEDSDVRFFWDQLAKSQHRNKSLVKADYYNLISLGTAAFLDALNYYDQADVWVAYVGTRELTVRYNQIEMLMSVTSPKGSPISSHMGIFRSLFYTGPEHSKISMDLHGFAAKIISELYQEKLYMLNFPINNMLNIMSNALLKAGKSCAIAYKNRDDYKNDKLPLKIEGSKVIVGEYILSADNQENWWFFENRCLFPQSGLNFPLVAVELKDLYGISSFSDIRITPILEEQKELVLSGITEIKEDFS